MDAGQHGLYHACLAFHDHRMTLAAFKNAVIQYMPFPYWKWLSDLITLCGGV